MNKHLTLLVCLCLLIVFAYGQKNIQLLGHLPYAQNLNDVWGYEDGLGNEYALVGTVTGLSIVDASTPTNPTELFFVDGATSVWRDIKTYNDYAYVSNETGEGILIVDLSALPASIDTTLFTADSLNLQTIHNLFIDENGILYVFGSNVGGGGALMFDLNTNPENPDLVGNYGISYIHDGYVRNDTMWSSEIYEGWLAGVDVTDKSNPSRFATRPTPNSFTHNNWMSDDGNYMFTTDEKTGSFVAAYDIIDVNNIKEVGRYQSQPGTGLIPHNTFYLNQYLVTSYYKNGVTITDASRVSNLVEVANFDTSPFISADGFSGCWGVYPFTNSGNLFATDIEEGLFILSPTYVDACYLEGNVTETFSGSNLNGVQAEIIGTNGIAATNLLGDYKTGASDTGAYVVRFVKDGCFSKYVTGVELYTDSVITLNVQLTCPPVSIGDNEVPTNYFYASPSIFSNQTTLHYSVSNSEAEIFIYNQAGKEVLQLQVNDGEGAVELSAPFAKGIYYGKIYSKNLQLDCQIVKQ